MSIDLSIIIVNFNGSQYFKNLFDSLHSAAKQDITFEIIVVDNASSDDSVHILNSEYSTKFENFIVIASRKNLGFAAGNNIGYSKSSGEYLVFLNNDTMVSTDWMRKILDKAKSTKAIVTPKLLFFNDFIGIDVSEGDEVFKSYIINGLESTIDSRFQKGFIQRGDVFIAEKSTTVNIPLVVGDSVDYVIVLNVNGNQITTKIPVTSVSANKFSLLQNCGSRVNEKLEGEDIGFGERDTAEYSRDKYVEAACGASMCLHRVLFENLRGFDPLFFMYYEDTDFSLRAKEMGVNVLFASDIVVRHVHTGSKSKTNLLFSYFVSRNKLIFVIKNYPKEFSSVFFKKAIRQVVKLLLQPHRLILSSKRRSQLLSNISGVFHATRIWMGRQQPRLLK